MAIGQDGLGSLSWAPGDTWVTALFLDLLSQEVGGDWRIQGSSLVACCLISL